MSAQNKKELGPLAGELAKWLKEQLADPEKASAATAEVARKLLADNDYRFELRDLPSPEDPVIPGLPTRDPDAIPALTS